MSFVIDNVMYYEKGDQIVYIPTHADFNLNHEDCEFGFVWKDKQTDAVFCRYWRKGKPGELRTKANSELTPRNLLFSFKSVSDHIITETIQEIERSNL